MSFAAMVTIQRQLSMQRLCSFYVFKYFNVIIFSQRFEIYMNVLLWSIPVWESKCWKTILLGELCLLYSLNFIINYN